MFVSIGFEPSGSRGGGGPDEDPRRAEQSVLTHGLASLAFGFALGLTLLLFRAFLQLYSNSSNTIPNNPIANNPIVNNTIVNQFNLVATAQWWVLFLIGLVLGTVIAGVYNMLVFRKNMLFGVDRDFS